MPHMDLFHRPLVFCCINHMGHIAVTGFLPYMPQGRSYMLLPDSHNMMLKQADHCYADPTACT